MTARLLVIGGAGYVGAHCVRHLADAGHEMVVFDDLSTGYREAVSGELVVGDIRDLDALNAVLARGFDAVLHFAAVLSVPESVRDPAKYWDLNVRGTLNLLHAMQAHGVDKLVFSSSCTVYGEPPVVPIPDDTPIAPISPYGWSKATLEHALRTLREAGQLASISLRYFNAAGCSTDGWIGESHDPETHLIPICLEAAATGRRMKIFGDDYPTRDGTCIRDYIHVEDLAEAHRLAVDKLLTGDPGGAYNLGTETGSSVQEILDAVGRVTGRPVPADIADRRPGDPPELVADAAGARAALGWVPQKDLDDIIASAWAWFQRPRYGPNRMP